MRRIIILIFFIFVYQSVIYGGTSNVYLFDDLVSIQPDSKVAVPNKTKCQVTYDDENIYFNWEAEMQEGFSIEKKGREDEFQDSDFLRAQITTLPGDNYCYVFYCYPDGSTMDAIRDNQFNLNNQWDSHFKAENSFDNNIWYCKMTVPFKDLRYMGAPPYHWNVSFCRQYIKSNTLYSDPFLSISLMGRDYFKNGHPITIDKTLPVNLNMQIIPYYTPVYDILNKKDRFNKEQFGMDFSFKPNSLMNFKLCMNPDFSDIPLDQAQNNFNLKYQPFYNENRYFFTEDLNVFDIDSDIFYSRNILQPEYAGKITGTNDAFNYGVLFCKDKDNIDNPYKDNYYGLFSIKPKFDNMEFGLYSINQVNDQYENYVLQINPALYFNSNNSIQWKNTLTLLKDSLETTEGIDSYLNINLKNEKWSYYIKIGAYTKDFMAKMGRIYDPSIAYGALNISYSDNNYKNYESFEASYWFEPTYITDPFIPMKINTGLYFKLDPIGPFYQDYNFSYNMLRENGKRNDLPQTRNYLGYSFQDYDFYLGFKYGFGRDYNYDLEKKLVYSSVEPSLDYKPFQYMNFNGSVEFYSYPYLSNNDQLIVDPRFHILNIEMKNYLSQKFNIASGYRYSQYFIGRYGFYVNLQYDIIKGSTIYTGISKGGFKEDGAWVTSFDTMYAKFRIAYSF